MEYVRDQKILERIGAYQQPNIYAVYTKGEVITSEMLEEEDKLLSSFSNDIEEEIDNSKCNADFENVSDNYEVIENYMYGDIKVYRKEGDFVNVIGIYDKTGLYKMQSARGTKGYLGYEGKAKCIAFPQCKFMNSTIFDNIAEHKVYRGFFDEFNKNKKIGDGKIEKVYDINQNKLGLETHLSFDVWIVAGAILGKMLKVWRGVAKLDMKKMPLYMTVTYAEIYETIVEGSKWENLSNESKYEWKLNLNRAFNVLNQSLLYDMPDENKNRSTYFAKHIMETTWIKRRAVGNEDEIRCINEWGSVWEPYGVKVRVRGSLLFDFCWRKKNNSPSLVQVRPYDFNLREIFGCKKSWDKSFAVIYAAWLVQYRNYWIKRGDGFKSCKLVWSRDEMKKAFEGNCFKPNFLTTDEMKKVMDWYSIAGVFNNKIKRPAHISSCEIIKRCEIGWELPASLRDENVLLKNENGCNISLEESGVKYISDEIKLAKSRMNGINDENNKHTVTVDGKKITTNESVIYRVKYDELMKENYIEENVHGRCYSLANGIQSLKRNERKRLKVNGNRVKEVDYSSLHPNMLYALNGIQVNNKDMYDVGNWYVNEGLSEEEARKAVKMMLLRMINAKNSSNAIYSFKKAWNEEHGYYKNSRIEWLYKLFNTINVAHSQIAHEFCTGKGIYLMNLDGKLIREVCWRLTREQICALGIHDSVIVESRYQDKAKQIMKEEYEKMFNGFTIKVSCK